MINQHIHVVSRALRSLTWWGLMLAAPLLAFSGCLDLTEPPMVWDGGSADTARFDVQKNTDSPSPSGGGTVGSGGISGFGGDSGSDLLGSGGVLANPTGGSGGVVDSGSGGRAIPEDGGAAGDRRDVSPTMPETGGESGGSRDGANGEAAAGGSPDSQDVSPDVPSDAPAGVVTDTPPDTAADAPPIPTNGLVAYYPCEQANGTSLEDLATSLATGTLHSATGSGGSSTPGYAFQSGKVGNALTLSQAGSGYVSLPTTVVTGSANLTLATWVKLTSVTTWQRLFDIGINANLNQNPATGTSYAALFLKDQNNKLGFTSTRNGFANAQQMTTDALPLGVWKHVAVVLENATGALYIDGVQVSTATSILPPQAFGNVDYAYIGKSQFGADPFIDAQVDEFRVYNRALSASEIRAIYSGN